MSYNAYWHTISLGSKYIAKLESIEELVAIVAHEFGHAFAKLSIRNQHNLLKDNCCFDDQNSPQTFEPESEYEHIKEYNADRYSNPRSMIATFLSSIINNKFHYNFVDYDSGHPNCRKRISILLEEMLGNGIFKRNGILVLKNNANNEPIPKYLPRTIQSSGEIVKKNTRKNIGYDRVQPRGSMATEDGRLVINWDELDKQISAKAEELMEKLDYFVEQGLDVDKKARWLAIVDRDVAQFRTHNKPEFLEPKKIPLGGWASGIKFSNPSQKNQR
jgi:hypothetical protein